jgi:hypothetical protein
VVLFATLLPDEGDRVLRAIDTMRDAMREESPALPPSSADAFVRLIDVGYEDATDAVAPASARRTVDVREEAETPASCDVSAEGALGASEYDWSDIFAARGRLEVSEAGTARPACGGGSAEGAFDRARSDSSAEAAFDPAYSDVSAEGAFDPACSDVSAEATIDPSRSDVSAEAAFDQLRSDVSAGTSSLHASAPDPARAHPSEHAATEPSRRKVCGGDVHRVVIHLAPLRLSEGLVANLDDGTWIAPETWRRVACDCALDLVQVDDDGSVLDVGRRTRTIPPALARALDVRDAGRCRFPGCTHRRFLDRHHVKHWSNDGETKLDNLLTLCTAHHQLVHEGGWSVELDGDEARFFAPDGELLVWPRPRRVEDAFAELEDAHVSLGIGPTTGLTRWDGKTPDYAWCVEAVS